MGGFLFSSTKIDTFFKFLLFLVILIFVLEYLSCIVDARVVHIIDAVGYYHFSKVPFFSADFWLGMRPVGYPLFIKLLQSNPNLVIAVQSLFYLVTWSFFAIYLYKRATNKLFGLISGTGVLVIVLHPNIAAWTHHVLTESLTFTFVPWIYMLLYEFLITKSKKYIYFLLSLLVFYSTIRDVNAYYVLFFILIFGILWIYKYLNRKDFLLASLVLLAAFIFSDYTANHSRNTITGKELTFESEGKTVANRWVLPFLDVMGHVVLNNSSMFEYMKKEGMPVNKALLEQKDKWGVDGWYDKPDLQAFRDWLAKSGKSTYTKFLVTHPVYTFGSIYAHRHQIFHYNMVEKDRYYKKYLWGYKVDNIFEYSSIENLMIYRILFGLIIILVLFSLIYRRMPRTSYVVVFGSLFLPIILLAVITFHGDSGDRFRHTLIIPFLLKMTMLMFIWVFGNELLSKKPK